MKLPNDGHQKTSYLQNNISLVVQCFQLSDIIILVWACRTELSHQTLDSGFKILGKISML